MTGHNLKETEFYKFLVQTLTRRDAEILVHSGWGSTEREHCMFLAAQEVFAKKINRVRHKLEEAFRAEENNKKI
jgi:hypothetical protein